jgi:hypothetical protein
MRKKIALFIATIFTVVVLPTAALADSTPPVTQVTGTVTNNSAGVAGADVAVLCGSTTLHDTTDGSGTYLVTFPIADCPQGSSATATAIKGGLSGSNSGPVNKVTNKLNIAVVDVSVIPEYGVIGITGAAILGGGAFMVMRRRQLGQN